MLLDTLWAASIRTRVFLRRWMPTNILLDWLRQRRNLRWGVPAMLLGVAYLAAAVGCILLIEQGWPEPLYLLFFLTLWNGLRFLLMGPISVLLLIRARTYEAILRRLLADRQRPRSAITRWRDRTDEHRDPHPHRCPEPRRPPAAASLPLLDDRSARP